ncbi:MAG: hypothetical protein VW455_01130, partial [Nitrospinota bacterium]
GGISDSGVITVAGTSLFNSDVAGQVITLDTTTNAMTGAVSITHTGAADVTIDNGTTALNLGTVSVGQNFTATSGGGITDSGVITVAGTGTFVTDVDDIDIVLDSSNAITGALTFTTQTAGGNGADVTFNNGSTAISLAAFTTEGNLTLETTQAIDVQAHTVNGNLSVTSSSGAISQTGALTVSGTSSFSAGSGQGISLATTTNALTGSVSLANSGAADIAIDNGTTALNLGTVTAGQNFSATSGGGISDSGVITVAGTSQFTSDVAGQTITLDSVNAMTGAVSITHTGAADVAIDNGTTALNLGTISVGQNFSATSGGGITDSGVITVAGTSSFTADVADQAITLDTTTNAMTGAVSFSTLGTSGNVTVDNGTTALNLGTVTANGNLSVTGGGGITDSGVITVSGTSSYNSDVAGQVITLDTTTNAMTGAVSITHTGAANVTIDNGVTALNLGTVSVGQNFSATSGSPISQSGSLTVAGTATFTTDTGDTNITLDNTSNAITGAITFITQSSGTNNADITLDNGSTAISLAGFTTEGDLSLRSDAAIALAGHTVNGNLVVTSDAGAITQSGALTVTGTSSFTTTAAGNSITLNTATNALTGAVSFSTSGTGDVTIDNGTTALNLGTVTVGQNLLVTSGEAITDSGVITVGGTAGFTTDVADKAITLDSQNAVTGQVSFSTSGTGGDVSFDNGTTALTLGTISSGDIGGDLILQTNAATTVSNAITMNGSGAALSITVDGGNALNIQNTLTTNAGAITLSADDDVIFTAAGDISSTNGNISVTADDDATSDAGSGGALTMADGTVFNAGSGTITGIADEDITLGQMTTTNATTAAITLNTASGNILDGGDTNEDLTAASGTVAVTTGGGTFGTTANAIEITSAALTTTGIPATVTASTSDQTLSGTTETVGEASVDQTINIVENLAMVVEQGNQTIPGGSTSTVSGGIDQPQPGPGPVIVDVFSQNYELVKTEGIDPGVGTGVNQLNNFWVEEEKEN